MSASARFLIAAILLAVPCSLLVLALMRLSDRYWFRSHREKLAEFYPLPR